MKTIQKKTHYLKLVGDYRYEALMEMFKGFNKALDNFKQKFEEISWYEGDTYYEETELIYGVVLVSLQNYINSCCADFIKIKPDGYTKNYQYYSENTKVIANDVSQIRLIIELANYFKHKNDKTGLTKNTRECFEKLDLLRYRSNEENGWSENLMIEGLEMLYHNDFNQLLPIVKSWRYENIERI
ncbi:hypothetical protein ACXR6G_16700 [Ancylomarina sp. YFZ004]